MTSHLSADHLARLERELAKAGICTDRVVFADWLPMPKRKDHAWDKEITTVNASTPQASTTILKSLALLDAKVQRAFTSKQVIPTGELLANLYPNAYDSARLGRLPEPYLDRDRIIEQPLSHLLNRAAQTMMAAVRECHSPNRDDVPAAVEEKLAMAIRLAAVYEAVDNYRYDFNVSEWSDSLQALRRQWPELESESRRRYVNGGVMEMLSNLMERFIQEVERLYNLELRLRGLLGAPIDEYESYHAGFPEAVVDAAFTAAVALEAFYEESSDEQLGRQSLTAGADLA